MLHRSHQGFDAPQFLDRFLDAASQRGMHTVTYTQLEAEPTPLLGGAADLLIITIDDIYLQAPIDPSVEEMIDILLKADAVAVLGVVTQGKAPDPETASTLNALAGRGWDIATHGDLHRDLRQMELEAPAYAKREVRESGKKLYAATGVQPTVLVLPFGQMVSDAGLLYKAGIKWAVGISGGTTIDLTDRVIYVGRYSPASSPEETLQYMLRPFASEP